MKLISFAAAVEAIAGLILMVAPSLVARFLFGSDLDAVGEAVARVGGFGLLGLGLACGRGSAPSGGESAATRGLLAYNFLATILFIDLGVRGSLVGLLLWPAAALHAVLTLLLGRLFVLTLRE